MAEAVVSLLVETLGGYIIQEATKCANAKKDLENLQAELKRLQGFLIDADAKRNKNESVRQHVNEIKELVADAEDVIERFILKQHPSKTGIRRLFSSIIKRPLALLKLHREIELKTSKLSKLEKSMKRLGVVESIKKEDSSSAQAELREMRKTYPQINQSDPVIGFEQYVEHLVARLRSERDQLQVVSICGMGGIGKTTLAKQVYNHGDVGRHFVQSAWVYISQQCNKRYVWEEIFRQLTRKKDGCRVKDEELQEELYKFLENNKCLVVLDDIWDTKDWDTIKPVFPIKTGNKILITTRYQSTGFHADPKDENVNFKPNCLNGEDSWKLFARQIFCGKNDAEEQMDDATKELAKKMLGKCGGLPLAIIALGGLLIRKDPPTQWQTVYKAMERLGISSQQMGADRVSQILSLSYDDLPSHLRNCFLYLSHYPEDHKIPANQLIQYWIAEEMIMLAQNTKNQSRKTIAEGYLEELATRNMVLVEKRSGVNSRIKRCRMHDVMGKFCLEKAEEEGFFEVINASAQASEEEISTPSSTNKPRRIAIHNSKDLNRLEQLKNPKARTLLRIPKTKYLSRKQPCDYLEDLKFIRVLDLSNGRFDDGKLPESIGKLIHLRYLNLQAMGLTDLTSSIGNLKLLVYLNLGKNFGIYIPNVLKKLRKLTFLKFPLLISSNMVKLELGDLVNLEILKNFPLGICDWRDLLHMTKLRKLKVRISKDDNGEIFVPPFSDAFKNIESFRIGYLSTLHHETTRVNAAQFLPELASANKLILFAKVDKLPDAGQFPPHIISIKLGNCKSAEDPMPILEKLPHLKVLELAGDVFISNVWKMVCSKSGFPQLQELSLDTLNNLEEWTVEEGSMPRLSRINISFCYRLKMLPRGLRYVRTLQWIHLHKEREFVERQLSNDYDYDGFLQQYSTYFQSVDYTGSSSE